ncbi:MAG: ribonuclease P [Nanohaloarchaea archaeon]|nr:ribonuclease P [Candidatus Nanohaloarchaea archaeon]
MVFKKRSRGKKKTWQVEIAKERMHILFDQADRRFKTDPDLSDRYMEIAKKISTKLNVPIPRELKRRFCRNCGAYLVYGANARQRVNSEKKYVIMTCLRCSQKKRIPYVAEKKRARKEKED